jgi:hypothetical protein
MLEKNPNQQKQKQYKSSSPNTSSVSIQAEKQNHSENSIPEGVLVPGNSFRRRWKSLISQPRNNEATNELAIAGSNCHLHRDEAVSPESGSLSHPEESGTAVDRTFRTERTERDGKIVRNNT